MKLKIKTLRVLLEYFLAFILLLDCRSVWLYLSGIQEWMPGILAFALLLAVIGLCLCNPKNAKRRQAQKWMLLAAGSAVYMAGYFFLKPGTPFSLLKLYAAFLLAITYSYLAQPQNSSPFSLLLCYKNIVLCLAGLSLILWFFGPVTGLLPATSLVYDSWGGGVRPLQSYFHLFYAETRGYSFLGLSLQRNIGFFTEAPMHSLHLSLALLTELFLTEKPDKKRCILLIVTIVTTISMTGYILVLLAMGYHLFLAKRKESNREAAKKILLFPVGAAVAAVAYQLVLAKLETSSGSTRLDDFQAGFQAWSQNWLLGNGYGNTEVLVQYMSSFRLYNTGFSNSPMLVLAQCGLYIGGVYLFGLIRGCLVGIRRRDWKLTGFTALTAYLFLLTSFPYTYLAVFLICLLNLAGSGRRRCV